MPVTVGFDALGWVVKPNIWLTPGGALSPFSAGFEKIPGSVSLALTFLLLLVLVSVGAFAQGFNLSRFIPSFRVVFGFCFLCGLLCHYAYIAQTPVKRAALGITWSLGLTGRSGLHPGAVGGTCDRQLAARSGALAQGRSPPGVVHQDGDRDPGRGPGRQSGGSHGAHVRHHGAGPRSHHRGVPDLLGPRLLHRPQVFPI